MLKKMIILVSCAVVLLCATVAMNTASENLEPIPEPDCCFFAPVNCVADSHCMSKPFWTCCLGSPGCIPIPPQTVCGDPNQDGCFCCFSQRRSFVTSQGEDRPRRKVVRSR